MHDYREAFDNHLVHNYYPEAFNHYYLVHNDYYHTEAFNYYHDHYY